MSASEHARTQRSSRALRARSTHVALDRAPGRLTGRGVVVRRWLLAADAAALVVAFVAVNSTNVGDAGVEGDLALFLASIPLWLVGSHLFGLYDSDRKHLDHSTLDELGRLVLYVSMGCWLGVVVAWALELEVGHDAVVGFWAAAIVALPLSRAAGRALARRAPGYVQNTLIVGAGDVGQLLGRKLRQHPELGIRLVGFVDADPKRMRADLDGVPVLGVPGDIARLVREHDVQRVVVSFSNDRHEEQLGLIHGLRDLGVHVDLVPRLFEAVGPVVAIHDVEGLKLLTLPPARAAGVARATKRLVDVVGATALIVLVGPLMLWIALRIRRDSLGPVLFRQKRLGEGMRPFDLLKFRTMAVDADDEPHREYVQTIMDPRATPGEGNLYKLARRDDVTKVGAHLRRTSLDELPQLFNVLRGEMSLVGPRPCLEYETTMFEPHHFDRFLVPAGMTGLWQVSARANATFREALDLDAAYARSWSLGLDVKLLIRTPAAVFRGRGATS